MVVQHFIVVTSAAELLPASVAYFREEIPDPSSAARLVPLVEANLLSKLPADLVSSLSIWRASIEYVPFGTNPHPSFWEQESDVVFGSAAQPRYVDDPDEARHFVEYGLELLRPPFEWKPPFRETFDTPLTPDDKPLTMDIPCWSGGMSMAENHTVTIFKDGHVDTLHSLRPNEIDDLESNGQRPPTCIEFARDVVPIVLNELPLLLRFERPGISLRGYGMKRLRDPLTCCMRYIDGDEPMGISDIAGHVRSLEHIQWKHQSEIELIGAMVDRISEVWGDLNAAPEDVWGASEYVSGRHTLQSWWDSGIHPRDVPALAASGMNDDGTPLSGFEIVRAAYSESNSA